MALASAAVRLEEAQEALHLLLTGTSAVTVRYNERLVTYTSGNIEELRKYIAILQGQVDPTTARRPLGVIW